MTPRKIPSATEKLVLRTHLPALLGGKRVFWDMYCLEKTIVIDLHDERYSELVAEVDDPQAVVKLIQNAL